MGRAEGRAEAERRYGKRSGEATGLGLGAGFTKDGAGRAEARRRYGDRIQSDPAAEQAALDDANERERARIAAGAMRLAAHQDRNR